MHHTPVHRLIACIVLVAFGLNATVLAHRLVRCTDGDGKTRLEWGCEKDTAGHCDEACAPESTGPDRSTGHSESTPCDDQPVTMKDLVSRTSDQNHRVIDLPPAVVAISLPQHMLPHHEVRCRLLPAIRGGPPTAMRSLRTVVLLVLSRLRALTVVDHIDAR